MADTAASRPARATQTFEIVTIIMLPGANRLGGVGQVCWQQGAVLLGTGLGFRCETVCWLLQLSVLPQ